MIQSVCMHPVSKIERVMNVQVGITWSYRGADKSLARPGRKQGNFSVRMAWISFGALPCKKRNLMTARVSMLLTSRASLTWFRACFLPGRPQDLTAPRCCRTFNGKHFNPLNTKLNPICHLLALLGAHRIFHVSGLRVKGRNLMFYWKTYFVPRSKHSPFQL